MNKIFSLWIHTTYHFFTSFLVTPAKAGDQVNRHSIEASGRCRLQDLGCSPGSPLPRGRQVGGILPTQKVTSSMFWIIALLAVSFASADTRCFLAIENNKILQQEGDCESRYSPRSSFKIALGLMGFDAGILVDEMTPEIPFKEGYYDYLEIWKQPHTPTLWMKNSCVWYSQVLTKKLGIKKFRKYIQQFKYGNQDISGDRGKNNSLERSWLSSSLKISCKEQVIFLQKLLDQKLGVNIKAYALTKNIIFIDELEDGWKLYGKTGTGNVPRNDGTLDEDRQGGWLVGWIEKDARAIIFACYIEQDTQNISAGAQAKAIAKEKLIHLIQETKC